MQILRQENVAHLIADNSTRIVEIIIIADSTPDIHTQDKALIHLAETVVELAIKSVGGVTKDWLERDAENNLPENQKIRAEQQKEDTEVIDLKDERKDEGEQRCEPATADSSSETSLH